MRVGSARVRILAGRGFATTGMVRTTGAVLGADRHRGAPLAWTVSPTFGALIAPPSGAILVA